MALRLRRPKLISRAYLEIAGDASSQPLLLSPVSFRSPLSPRHRFITLASTTSTEHSGLLGHIIPLFRQQAGINVRVVAVGTGQALQIGMRGDADALLVHDREVRPGSSRKATASTGAM
jgi:ABC-type tungstate transport system permease subunit